MARTYVIHYHPLSLRHWLNEHQRLVRSLCGLMIATLAVAIATPTASMVWDAIAAHTDAFAQGAERAASAELPREWRQSREPITFDHMFRQDKPQARVQYIRDPRHKNPSWSAE